MSLLAFEVGDSMRQRQIDPGLLEGEELDRWYRRSFDEMEAEHEAVPYFADIVSAYPSIRLQQTPAK